MRLRFLLPLLLLPCLILAAAPAWGQQADTTDAAAPELPDIAPREVEIRGQLEISLPSLQRQPLIGFNPPPRITEIPADRRPYTGDYDQEKPELPPTPLSRPDPPQVSALAGGDPVGGTLEMSAGRYFSRRARARTGLPISRHETFYGHLDYDGTDGHEPFDELGVRTPFDVLDAQLGLKTTRSRLAAGVEAEGFYDEYSLFGAELAQGAGDLSVPPDPHPTRTGRGGSGALWLRSLGTTRTDFDLRLRYGAAAYDTEVFEEDQGDPVRTEQRFDVDAQFGVPVDPGTLLLDADLSRWVLDEEGANGHIDAGLSVQLRPRRRYQLTLGLHFLGYSASDRALRDFSPGAGASSGFLSPVLRLEVYPTRNVRLYAQNQPSIEAHPLSELYRTNPYLVPKRAAQSPLLTFSAASTLRVVDAEGGGTLFLGPVQLTGRAGYQLMPNYLFFEAARGADAVVYARGLWRPTYEEAEVFYLGGDVSFVLPAGLHTSFGLRYREGRLTDGDTAIPYFSPLTAEGMLAYSFDRGLLELVGTYGSTRPVDREETERMDALLDIDFSAHYYFTPALALVGRVENMSAGGLERWPNYPRAPWILTTGLQVRW